MRRIVWLLALVMLAVPVQAQRRLPTNRRTVLPVGPFLDATNGVTPETAMTVTNITCELYREFDDHSAPTRTEITLAASGSDNDMVHITYDVAGMYSVELTAAQLNFVGRARLCFTDSDVCGPVWEDLIIEPNNVFDSDVSGSDYRKTDAVQISGSSTAADNAEIVYDTDFATGYDTTTNMWNVDLEYVGGSSYGGALIDATEMQTIVEAGATAVVGSGGGSLTTVPWNTAWADEVQSEAADALTAYAPATATALATAQADLDNPTQYKATGFSTHSAADVATAIWAKTVDGETFQSLMEILLAFTSGKVVVTPGTGSRTISYYKQDGSTIKLTIVGDTTYGGRAAGGSIDP